MTRLRQHLFASAVAIAAVAGMLSAAGEASASTASGTARNDSRGCCAKRACTGCCCEPATAQERTETTQTVVLSSRRGSLAIPARSCECRRGEPAAPASRQESQTSESRADLGQGEPVDLTTQAAPLTGENPGILRAEAATSPLYLSTARLRI
jgi:hypothetical protein